MLGANQEPSVLPRGWVWARLGDVCEINPSTDISGIPGNPEVAFVPMAAVAECNGRIDPTVRRRLGQVRRGFTRFQPGDVIFAKITPCMENGKIAVVPDLPFRVGFGSTEFHVLRPRPGVNAELVFNFLLQQKFRNEAGRNMSGAVGQRRVPTEFLRSALFPLAPSAEQVRIIARLSELLSEIEAGEQELEKAREALEVYRRAVLKAAVTGELTREWREKNPPTETGVDFLRRILKQRRLSWERTELEKIRNNGRSPASDAWRERYAEARVADTSVLPKLPEGWVSASLAQLCELVGGITVDAKRQGDDLVDVPYLRVANVQRGRLDLNEVKTIRVPAVKVRQLRLLPNDVLMCEGGDKDKVGRGCIWSGELRDCIHQNHVFRARPIVHDLDGRFISAYANEMGRGYFLRGSKQTTNLASINLTKVAALPVPLPPAAEIAVIVGQITETEAVIAALESAVADAHAYSIRLRQSILSAAFSGRLVPQDSRDEPAVLLLERLRAALLANKVPRKSGDTVDTSRARNRQARKLNHRELPL
jgi:type I restriction enzyme, S subunit